MDLDELTRVWLGAKAADLDEVRPGEEASSKGLLTLLNDNNVSRGSCLVLDEARPWLLSGAGHITYVLKATARKGDNFFLLDERRAGWLTS